MKTTVEFEFEKPQANEHPDFSSIIKECQDNLDVCEEEGREIKDIQHYIYVSAMEAVFGESVWGYIEECEERWRIEWRKRE